MLQTFEEVNALLSPCGSIQSIMTDEERAYIWNCIRAMAPCKVIEIGSAYGGTTLLMALAGAEVWSVDSWICGQRSAFIENTRPMASSIHMVEGDSTSCADLFADDNFDLVLVDGDHGQANGGIDSVPYRDIVAYQSKVKIGGYFLVDDTNNGHPAVTTAVERFQRESKNFVLDVTLGSKLMGFRRV